MYLFLSKIKYILILEINCKKIELKCKIVLKVKNNYYFLSLKCLSISYSIQLYTSIG